MNDYAALTYRWIKVRLLKVGYHTKNLAMFLKKNYLFKNIRLNTLENLLKKID